MHVLSTTSFFGSKTDPRSQEVVGPSGGRSGHSYPSCQRPVRMLHRVNKSTAKDERVTRLTKGEVIGLKVLLKDIADLIEIVGEPVRSNGNEGNICVARLKREGWRSSGVCV